MKLYMCTDTTKLICRTMRAFKPLRIVVDCFFAAAPLMSSVIALIFFFIFITGLVGMQVCSFTFLCVCGAVSVKLVNGLGPGYLGHRVLDGSSDLLL